jgi:MFS family permease
VSDASASILAPFRVRSYRYQWPADLATSWAFEMETLILGWYVLVETGSVLLFTVFASLYHLGTLLAPIFGTMGDRIGTRILLSGMRAFYTLLAATVMTLALTGVLTPVYVLITAGLVGIVRPSDMGMRAALVGDIMPPGQLMGAMSVQRTTMDTARIAGALTGAGVVAALGIGPAYIVVTTLYATSFLLTRKVAGRRHTPNLAPDAVAVVAGRSPWRDLKAGLAYVWNTPLLLGVMCLALLVNLTAFPLYNGLLAYVAKEIYHTDQTGLGYMVACAASGALTGSIVLSRFGSLVRPGRMLVVCAATWYAMLLLLAHTQHLGTGMIVLFFVGLAHSLGQIPMFSVLLRSADERYRGRVMGIRMMMIYGMPMGMLMSAPLIGRIGYTAMATLYCAIGFVFIVVIVLRWREYLWRADAPANRR